MRMRIMFVVMMVFHVVHGYAEGLWSSYTSENSDLLYIEVFDVAIDHNNVKWILSKRHYEGYYEIHTYDDVEWDRPTTYGTTEFTAVTVDHDNNVWLGRAYHHLLKFNANTRKLIKTYNISDLFGEWTSNISDMVFDNYGLLWLALPGRHQENIGKVCTFDGESSQTIIDYRYVHGLACDSHNNVWGAASYFRSDSSNLYKFYRSEIIRYSIDQDLVDSDPSIFSQHIAIDHDDVKWLSIAGMQHEPAWIGLASFIDGVWTLYTPDNSPLPDKHVMDIAVDNNNVKWIATDAGLARFDDENWEVFTTENSGLIDNHVLCVAVEENNTLWIGTEGGLSKYTGDIITAVDEEPKPEALPTVTAYPNPFNPSTTISFTLPESGHALLSIYNLIGQMVRMLTDEPMTAGNHTVVWDGRDDAGNAVAAGVYVTRLMAGGTVATGKMVLVK